MVLANRLKSIHVLWILLVAVTCLAKSPFNRDCSADIYLSKFLENDSNWVVDRKSGNFSPILGLRVFESKLWVSTYASDFFPATIKYEGSLLLIENIRFRIPTPAKIQNDPAELVKEYRAEGTVFAIPLFPGSCDIQDELRLEIMNLTGRNREVLVFTRSDIP